jgi:hypothetical protein
MTLPEIRSEHYGPIATMLLNLWTIWGFLKVGLFWNAVYWVFVFGINYIVAFKLK